MTRSRNFKTFFVVNPSAGRGQIRASWGEWKRQIKDILGSCDYAMTDSQGHGLVLAAEAVRNGYEMIVAVGGDGTINEVVNGIFEDKKKAGQVVLGIWSAGYGDDLARSLQCPKSLRKRLHSLTGRHTRKVDIGSVSFHERDGMEQHRYFVNVTGCGLPGELIDEVRKRPRSYGGKAGYLFGLARALRAHENCELIVTVDSCEPIKKKALCAIVANGQYFGGGIRVAPDAVVDDGWLDLVLVGDIRVRDVLLNLSKIYRGQIRQHPEVEIFRAKRIKIASKNPVLLDTDGEQTGVLPAAYQVHPQALSLKV